MGFQTRKPGDPDKWPDDYHDKVFVADVTRITSCVRHEGHHCLLHIELCDADEVCHALIPCDIELLKMMKEAINETLAQVN